MSGLLLLGLACFLLPSLGAEVAEVAEGVEGAEAAETSEGDGPGLSGIPVVMADGTPSGASAPALLAELTRGVEVLGIGESIHLSGGLERARAGLAAHALHELGFQVLALELSWVEGRAVELELQACAAGQTDMILAEFSDPLWDGLRPLLQELCEHNRAEPADPFHVLGIDVQDSWNHRQLIEADLGERDEALRACHGAWVDSAAELRAWGEEHGFPEPSRAQQRRCLARLRVLARRLSEPDSQRALASLRATELTNRAMLVRGDVAAAYELREAAMADALHVELGRLGGGRVVLLAHDNHVARSGQRYRPLGARLADVDDLDYVAVSVGGYRVETRFGPQHAPPLPGPESREATLHGLGHPLALVDLREGEGPHDAQLFVDHASAE